MFMALKHIKGFIWFYLQFYCISINSLLLLFSCLFGVFVIYRFRYLFSLLFIKLSPFHLVLFYNAALMVLICALSICVKAKSLLPASFMDAPIR